MNHQLQRRVTAGWTTWPEELDKIVGGDHVAMLASATPAKGAVLAPLSNFGTRDRARGTITVNSSVGAWKKLDRILRNPNVALAFHTREHGLCERPEFVLAQGRAALSEPIPDYPEKIIEHWERFEPWRDLNPLWKRWLRVFALRVEITVSLERLVVWPDLECRGEPQVLGAPLPPSPPPQQTPARGTGPRLNHVRAATRASRLPDVLLGWIGADGLPIVVPVGIAGTVKEGILLDPPPGMVPAGGRRAGLTAHWFSPRVIGQNQRVHTGWLEAGGPEHPVVYSPHTSAAYRFPASLTVFQLVAGAGTRWRLRQGRRGGFLDRIEGDR